jgi:AAA domain
MSAISLGPRYHAGSRCTLIIWVNGPFGVGKTQTAFELHARLPNSVVFDPEELGFALRKVTPRALQTGDFQDLPLWREFTRKAIEDVAQRFTGVIIVPMTLVISEYFNEIIEPLRSAGLEVRHFSLLAPRDVVLNRLRIRREGVNSWGARQLERCLTALERPEFAQHLNTENKSISSVAEQIASHCGLTLLPNPASKLTVWLRRLKTQIRHIRF